MNFVVTSVTERIAFTILLASDRLCRWTKCLLAQDFLEYRDDEPPLSESEKLLAKVAGRFSLYLDEEFMAGALHDIDLLPLKNITPALALAKGRYNLPPHKRLGGRKPRVPLIQGELRAAWEWMIWTLREGKYELAAKKFRARCRSIERKYARTTVQLAIRTMKPYSFEKQKPRDQEDV